jgi:hypothetical protein
MIVYIPFNYVDISAIADARNKKVWKEEIVSYCGNNVYTQIKAGRNDENALRGNGSFPWRSFKSRA